MRGLENARILRQKRLIRSVVNCTHFVSVLSFVCIYKPQKTVQTFHKSSCSQSKYRLVCRRGGTRIKMRFFTSFSRCMFCSLILLIGLVACDELISKFGYNYYVETACELLDFVEEAFQDLMPQSLHPHHQQSLEKRGNHSVFHWRRAYYRFKRNLINFMYHITIKIPPKEKTIFL